MLIFSFILQFHPQLLLQEWLHLVLAGTAASTNRLYATKQRCFVRFCYARQLFILPLLETVQLLPYTNHLFNQGLRPNTVSTHLAALRHMSIINGFGDPMINTPMLTLARRGATAASPPDRSGSPSHYQHYSQS